MKVVLGLLLAAVVLAAGLASALEAPKQVYAAVRPTPRRALAAAGEVGGCDVHCQNPEYCCNSGYFCIDSRLCLRGKESDYADAAFIGVGILLGIIEGETGVSLTAQCVDDVFASVDVALATFNAWDRGEHATAMGDLRSLFGDFEKTWSACRASSPEPWWEKVINMAAKILSDFFPEIKAVATGYEILIHGEDIWDDYNRMRDYCGAGLAMQHAAMGAPKADGSYSDWVNCGIGIGNFGYQVYNLLTDAEAPQATNLVATVYSDNGCATSVGTVAVPLHTCVPLPVCPEANCDTIAKCVRGDVTLAQLLTCAGCSTSPSELALSLDISGSDAVEHLFYGTTTCQGSPIYSSNITMNTCFQHDHFGCSMQGSVKITAN